MRPVVRWPVVRRPSVSLVRRAAGRVPPLVTGASRRAGRAFRRAAPYLLAIGAAGASALALLPEPPDAPPPTRADFAIVVGAAGLRWDDIDAASTPNLWKLAGHGSIGALSVRSANSTTCPADGWLTLGAGNRARRTSGPVQGHCPALGVTVEPAREPAVVVADQREVVAVNRLLPWPVQPGALAEAVRCTTAIGPGAALAAARPFGRIDRYVASLGGGLSQQQLAQHLQACSLTIVDAGTVLGEGAARHAAVKAVDAAVARVVEARPGRSLVIVAGLSDTGRAGRLHVAIADGPGYRGSWLTSRTTGRDGYVQLVDLAPTVLEALDRPVPDDLVVGKAAARGGDRPSPLKTAVGRLADADRQASVQHAVARRFLAVLAVGQLLLLVAVIPVLRRARRPAGPRAPRTLPAWLRRITEIALVASALAVPAAMLADLLPWWRWRSAWLVFAAVAFAILAVATGVGYAATRRHRSLGPVGVLAAVAAVAVAADVMTGSRLQLNGVAGYSAVTGGRYAGVGTVALGVLVAGTLLVAGALAQRVAKAWRPCVVAAIGAAGVVVIGSPYLGADAAGAVALSTGVCLAAAASSGGWFTVTRLAAAGLTAVVVTTGFALLDLTRPAGQRSNIGRFLLDLGNGSGGLAGERLGEHNVTTIADSPFTLLVIGAGLFVWLVAIRPWGGLRRLYGLYPALRGALGGIVAATLFAGLAEGVGLNVLGAATATAVPLAVLGALRVLDHAHDRTQPGRAEGTASGRAERAASGRAEGTSPGRDDGTAPGGDRGAGPAEGGGVTREPGEGVQQMRHGMAGDPIAG